MIGDIRIMVDEDDITDLDAVPIAQLAYRDDALPDRKVPLVLPKSSRLQRQSSRPIRACSRGHACW